LTASDGTFLEFRFSDYFYQKKYLDLLREHPFQSMLGALIVILALWLGVGVALAIIHALAYIILVALCAAIVIWGVAQFAKIIVAVLERAGVPVENLDHFKKFFQWKKDQFKRYFENQKLDWSSKRS
jgi:hypothetical protein